MRATNERARITLSRWGLAVRRDRHTMRAVTVAADPPAVQEEAPPRRFLLRPAGVLTQLASASCLLLGTIALVLVQQNKSGGTALVIAWAIGAMAGLVFGGLMARGSLISVLVSAALVATFGTVLLVIDYDALRSILRLLPDSDVAMIADILVGAAVGMVVTAVLCLASIPQALAYGRAVREAEAEQAGSSASFAQAMPVAAQTVPPHAPSAYIVPPGPGVSTGELVQRYSVPSLRPAAGGSFGQPGSAQGGSTKPGVPAVRGAADSAAQTKPSAPAVPSQYEMPPDPYQPPVATGGPPQAGEYVDPLQTHIPAAASTARGWAPSPARTTTTLVLRPKAEEARSRRRVYFILGGLAVGVGAGVGVMVSSTAKSGSTKSGSGSAVSTTTGSAKTGSGSSTGTKPVFGNGSSTPATGSGSAIATGSGSGIATGAGSGTTAGSAEGSGSAGSAPVVAAAPDVPIRSFLATQRDAIAKADAHGLVEHIAPTAFAFGVNADDIAEGRAAIEAMLAKNLGDAPPDGFRITSKYLQIGELNNHAWVAEELELDGGDGPRRIAITQLAAFLDGKWTTVALHWGEPVPDAVAERRAVLGNMPRLGVVPNKADGGSDLDRAVRAAFSSRTAFVDARSERDDAFNFGSGPGERTTGGAIKRLFARLRSDLKISGGARVVAGSTWDPGQATAPWIGFAALNADYTYKSRAATDLTQTFRVLAIMIREGDVWTIVQTQFSNGGPVR